MMAIPFSCPSCGKAMVVDDQYAGQTGPCSNCGKPITIPAPAAMTKAGGGGLAVMAAVGCALVLGCLVVGGIVTAILLPVMNVNRTTPRQASSSNNIKQIMLALHNYHDVNGMFPPAYVADADGKPLYSWRVLLLPYLEQGPMFNGFDRTKAWDDPVNITISHQTIDAFRSPLDTAVSPYGCNYFVLVGPNGVFTGNTSTRMADITDGTSNTISIVELQGVPGSWAAPIDPQVANISMSIGSAPGQLNSTLPDRILVGLTDGSVQTIPADTSPQTLQLLFDRRDNQPVMIPQ